MRKNNPVSVSAGLNMISSQELSKSVAADLNVPDPTGIITKGKAKVNENPTKYDRGTSSVHDIPDIFSPRK
jgi:hypothetical protein